MRSRLKEKHACMCEPICAQLMCIQGPLCIHDAACMQERIYIVLNYLRIIVRIWLKSDPTYSGSMQDKCVCTGCRGCRGWIIGKSAGASCEGDISRYWTGKQLRLCTFCLTAKESSVLSPGNPTPAPTSTPIVDMATSQADSAADEAEPSANHQQLVAFREQVEALRQDIAEIRLLLTHGTESQSSNDRRALHTGRSPSYRRVQHRPTDSEIYQENQSGRTNYGTWTAMSHQNWDDKW